MGHRYYRNDKMGKEALIVILVLINLGGFQLSKWIGGNWEDWIYGVTALIDFYKKVYAIS